EAGQAGPVAPLSPHRRDHLQQNPVPAVVADEFLAVPQDLGKVFPVAFTGPGGPRGDHAAVGLRQVLPHTGDQLLRRVTEENRPLVDVGGPPLGRYGALTPRGSEQEPCRGQRFALCAWARSEGDPVEPDGDFSPAVAQEEVGPARAAFAVLGTTQVGPR